MQVKATLRFTTWLDKLDDLHGRARILVRIRRLSEGNPGQHKRLKFGISELKIDVGPGYRVYYTLRRKQVIVLLCGGDKSRQSRDIELAYELVRDLEN
jgi:putative addiction module killer protein